MIYVLGMRTSEEALVLVLACYTVWDRVCHARLAGL